MKGALERNREYSDRYIQKIEKPKIPDLLKKIIKKSEKIIDLGCGYGNIIQAIKKRYPKKKIIGVDISPVRIKFLKEKYSKDKFLCRDVVNTKLKKDFFDLIISTQVIEHLKDDKKFINEIGRIMKKGGYVYISSVIKKPWAVYKYRNKGKFVLDPTHEKEYKHEKEFLDLFKEKFSLVKFKIFPVKRRLLFLEIKIPGYYIIEGL